MDNFVVVEQLQHDFTKAEDEVASYRNADITINLLHVTRRISFQ